MKCRKRILSGVAVRVRESKTKLQNRKHQRLKVSVSLTPASTAPPQPHSLSFSQGVIIVNHLIAEARVNPRFQARWKVSRQALQTPCRQQIKADALWWSYTMLLWYCSTQRSTDLGWMTKFDRTFQLISLPFPFKVMQCAALIIQLFLSRCFVVRGRVIATTRLSWEFQKYKILKKLDCNAFSLWLLKSEL